jgi:hypothetical protein
MSAEQYAIGLGVSGLMLALSSQPLLRPQNEKHMWWIVATGRCLSGEA